MPLRNFAFAVLLFVGVLSLPSVTISDTSTDGQTYLLAVGICPPYRAEIPVSTCRNSVKQVADNLTDNIDLRPENIKTLTDENSTGQNFLSTLHDYKNSLSENDRLLVYMLLHGDPYYEWEGFYDPQGAVGSASAAFVPPSEDVLVFWTKEQPTVPALALAQSDWLTASEVAKALDDIDAKVGLFLDSCSSGLFFRGMMNRAVTVNNIDFVMTSSGDNQVSNFDLAQSSSLFSREFSNALNLPGVQTLGAALQHARVTTVLHASAQCTTFVLPTAVYEEMYPDLPVPEPQTRDGQVTMPLWSCAQVPSIVDLTGEVSSIPIK